MDFNATVDLIIRELEEAREIIDDLRKFPGAPALQIELAKSKCKNAADVIAMLKNMPELKHEPEKMPERTHEHTPDIEENEKKPEHKAEHKEQAIDENASAEQKPKKPYVAPIIADTFSHLANRFNEQIGESQGDDFSYMHGRKYENLSEAIGINDRFYYISEIFDGNREHYNEAMARLDKVQSIQEAKDILADYKNEKTSHEAVKQLLDLTRRKFGPNE